MLRRSLALVAISLLFACEQRSRGTWGLSKGEPSSSATSTAASTSIASAAPASTSTSASTVAATTSPSSSASSGASSVPQLHYGVVTLSGTLAEQTFPGPPGYGSDPAHDAKENVLVLQLFAPVDVLRTDADDDWNEDRLGVRKVSLATPKDVDALRKSIGKAIKVKGKLYGAHSPKDHTDVSMSDVELVPE
jgi:hypothetical protein